MIGRDEKQFQNPTVISATRDQEEIQIGDPEMINEFDKSQIVTYSEYFRSNSDQIHKSLNDPFGLFSFLNFLEDTVPHLIWIKDFLDFQLFRELCQNLQILLFIVYLQFDLQNGRTEQFYKRSVVLDAILILLTR